MSNQINYLLTFYGFKSWPAFNLRHTPPPIDDDILLLFFKSHYIIKKFLKQCRRLDLGRTSVKLHWPLMLNAPSNK